MTLVERDGLSGLLRRAAAAHPRCLLNLIISGLYHYMELRERREFRCLLVHQHLLKMYGTKRFPG